MGGVPTARREAWPWALVLAAFGWSAVGIWPFAPVECDSLGVAASVDHLARYDRAVDLSYNFHGTSGTYHVLLALVRATGIPAYPLYAALSALAAAGFLVLGARLLGRLLDLSPAWIALGLLTFQESTAAAWYPNSNVLASVCLMAAAWIALDAPTQWRVAWAGVAFGLAGWLRADAALMALVFPLLLVRGVPRRAWVPRVALFAGVSGGVAVGAILLGGADLTRMAATTATVLGGGSATASAGSTGAWYLSPPVLSHLSFLTVAHVVLLALGTWTLVARRRWDLLALVLAGTVPLWLAYGGKLTTPKQLHYLIPYLALPMLAWLAWSARDADGRVRWRRAGPVGALLALQLVFGVRATLTAKPWIGDAEPAGVTLGGAHLARGPLSRVALVVGPGVVLPTDDGPRLSSGTLFAPWAWHARKAVAREEARALVADLRDPARRPARVWAATCNGAGFAQWAAVQAGLEVIRQDERAGHGRTRIWQDGHGSVVFRFLDHADYDLRTFGEPGARGLYIVGSGRERRIVRSSAAAVAGTCGDDGLEPFGRCIVAMPAAATPTVP